MPTTTTAMPTSSPTDEPTVQATPTGSGHATDEPNKGMPGPEAKAPDERPMFASDDSFTRLVQQANDGDNAALKQLRSILDESPEVWQRVGNLAAHARLTLIRLIAAGDKLLFESIERKAGEMESELLGPSSTPLERLSVERVVSCWLQLQYCDTASAAPSETITQQKFWAQRQDQAHRRYQAAVRQLLAVRQAVRRPSKTDSESATSPAIGATEATSESKGAQHVEVAAQPRPAAGNGNGRVNGPPPGNGRDPEPSDEPVPANGKPVNRILAFSEPMALPSPANQHDKQAHPQQGKTGEVGSLKCS